MGALCTQEYGTRPFFIVYTNHRAVAHMSSAVSKIPLSRWHSPKKGCLKRQAISLASPKASKGLERGLVEAQVVSVLPV